MRQYTKLMNSPLCLSSVQRIEKSFVNSNFAYEAVLRNVKHSQISENFVLSNHKISHIGNAK